MTQYMNQKNLKRKLPFEVINVNYDVERGNYIDNTYYENIQI